MDNTREHLMQEDLPFGESALGQGKKILLFEGFHNTDNIFFYLQNPEQFLEPFNRTSDLLSNLIFFLQESYEVWKFWVIEF